MTPARLLAILPSMRWQLGAWVMDACVVMSVFILNAFLSDLGALCIDRLKPVSAAGPQRLDYLESGFAGQAVERVPDVPPE